MAPTDERGRIRQAMQEGSARAVQALGWTLAGFYAALAAYWWFAIRPLYPVLEDGWVVASLVLAGFSLAAGRGSAPPARKALADIVAVVVISASILLVAATRNPALTLANYIAILGLGLVLASPVTLGACVAAICIGWAAVAAANWGPEWMPRGIALVACCIVALAAQQVRIRLYARLERAKAGEVAAAREAERAKAARAELEAKAAFLRLAAHQLATPLTTVTLQARALARAHLPEELRRPAGLLERNVARLNRLLRDIVAITQAQEGLAPASLNDIDLVPLVHAQVAAAGRRLGTSIDAVVLAPGSVRALADPQRLSDVLDRLLENVVVHGNAATPRPAEEAAAEPPARALLTLEARGDRALLSVRDFGPGIPRDQAVALFQPLASMGLEAGKGGLGLGLALARLHTESMGGVLSYEDAAPGACFTVSLRRPR